MSKYWAFFDTETGGFNEKEVDVLTFYMCIVDADKKQIVDEIDLKLKPNGGRQPVAEEQALQVNKIDVEAHMADPETVSYDDGKTLIVAMLKKWHKKTGRYNNIRPAGQNVGFDIRFVQQHIMPQKEWESLFHYSNIDTKNIVDFLKDCGWFPSDLGSLETVVKYLQMPMRLAHNAKEDTLMCLDVYKKLLEIMDSKKAGGSNQDIISLLETE